MYNYNISPDITVIDQLGNNRNERDDRQRCGNITLEEVQSAIKTIKNGKAPGVDSIPAELLKAGGEHVSSILHKICSKAWQEGTWPSQWTKSILLTLFKKGDIKRCENYRTISLISHPSKVLIKILLERLKPQIEKILTDEQAGFRSGRSTTEPFCNLRVLCEKQVEKGHALHHNLVDFKKAFARIWQKVRLKILRIMIFDSKLVDMIETLYNDL